MQAGGGGNSLALLQQQLQHLQQLQLQQLQQQQIQQQQQVVSARPAAVPVASTGREPCGASLI